MSNKAYKVFPQDIGVIHFIGIGGIGMSGMAEILHQLGYKIQGSDPADNYVTERLKKAGMKVFNQHLPENVRNASLIVKSTAIKDSCPEIIAGKQLGIPIIKRAEMLAELMRFKHSISISGTHGKTTTTSIVASLFEAADLKPTVINGGIINANKTNAYLGEGHYLIAEADESDGTFIRVPSYVGVITNIDPEHLDYYGTFDKAKAAYKTFIENLPFYGFGVLCYDHPTVRELGNEITDRRVITYGISSSDVDFRAENIEQTIEGSIFDVVMSDKYIQKKKLSFSTIKGLKIKSHGKHNVQNSLAAIAIAVEKGFATEVIKQGLLNFEGVKRRFTMTGKVDDIVIIDDYAHHPVEIKATLDAAKGLVKHSNSKVIAVLQPHRYSRLHGLMEDFSTCLKDADHVIIADVYAAGEAPIANVNADELIKHVKHNAKQEAIKLNSPTDLAEIINKLAKKHDLVVFLGAGNITKWAYDLPEQLQELRKVS